MISFLIELFSFFILKRFLMFLIISSFYVSKKYIRNFWGHKNIRFQFFSNNKDKGKWNDPEATSYIKFKHLKNTLNLCIKQLAEIYFSDFSDNVFHTNKIHCIDILPYFKEN